MITYVAHVMRTYGVHGGERQLGQLFMSFSNDTFRHLFFFVYRDDVCARHFQQTRNLRLETLLPLRSRIFPSLSLELAVLLLCLPVLQIRLLLALRRSKCRICVAHGLQGGMVSWLAALVLRDMRFVYVHRGTKSKLGRFPLFKLLYWPFNVVSGVSRASTDSLRGLVNERKLLVLENGIDWQAIDHARTTCPAKDDGPLVISCVGRLMPAKGHRLLMAAFALFQNSHPTSELWIVGDGPDNAELRQVAEKLGITSKVRFLGQTTRVVCVLVQSDIFTHASESEGLSNAVLEAMAVGLPSVVVNASGVSECHVDGTTGFVVERSAEALSAKLAMLADNATLRALMGEQARKRAGSHYSIQANCERYTALYKRLAGGT